MFRDVHVEKRSVKFTGSSVLIWTTWLFSKFYQKLSLINRFSVRFTQRPVKSTEYEKIRVKSCLYCTLSELYRKSVDWTQLPVNFTDLFSACSIVTSFLVDMKWNFNDS